MLFIKLFILVALLHISVDALTFVLKLKEHFLRKRLQDIINEVLQNQHVQITQDYSNSSIFYLNDTEHQDPDSSFKLMDKLKFGLENRPNPIVVKYLRSSRFCWAISELLIAYTTKGEKANYHRDLMCEDGGNIKGANWNEAQLQAIWYEHRITRIEGIDLSRESGVRNFVKNLALINSISVSKFPLIAKKYNQLNQYKWDTLNNASLNLSNNALRALDESLLKIHFHGTNYSEAIYQKFAIRVEKIGKTNSEGVMFVDKNADTSNGKLVAVLKNTSNNDVQVMSPTVGIRFPKSAVEDFKKKDATIAYVFFSADSPFFGNNCSLTTDIISATHSSGQMQPFDGPVVIWLKRNASYNPGGCVSWNLNASAGKCGWTTKGCMLNNSHRVDEWTMLDECHCTHLTHFGELLVAPSRSFVNNRDGNSSKQPDEPTEADGLLDLISTVCCGVALVCLSVVLVAAILNKQMLKSPGQKIQLQLVANLALLLSLFLLVLSLGQRQSESVCKIFGLTFVYVLFANVVWMGVAGYLQYMRLVRVLYVRTSHFVLKTAMVGWALPLLPVLVMLCFLDHFSSKPPLCRPMEGLFYGAVLAPLCLVLLSNLVIFAFIVKNLFVNFKPRSNVKRSVSVMRFKQLVFMFTLFGMNWTFGVLQIVDHQIWKLVFAYLFNISIAFQGLAYLVFFVLLHEGVKSKVQKLFCNTNSADSSNVATNSVEMFRTTLSKDC